MGRKLFTKAFREVSACCVLILLIGCPAQAQSQLVKVPLEGRSAEHALKTDLVVSPSQYVDPVAGTSVEELVQTALARNVDLLAARQRVTEAQGLLLQAGLHPNPGIELSATNGSVLGSTGEREVALSYAHTFELGAKRAHRVEAARLALEVTLHEVANRERQLRADIKGRYGEALAAVRNLETAIRLLEVNQQSYQLTQLRVSQGEAAAYEERLLRVEVARIESDRLLLENQVDRALLELKTFAGISLEEPLRLRGDLGAPLVLFSLAEANERALADRPDLKALHSQMKLAEAEVQLARSEGIPNLIGFVRYSRVNSRFDLFGLDGAGRLAPISDTDNLLTTGVSIALPARSRNQGSVQAAMARLEAARLRQQFGFQVVRREVKAAYTRYESAQRALQIFAQRVIGPSQDNLRVIRAAYDLGELRLLDVINEQRRLIDTQKAYTEVLKEHYQTQVELERAVGTRLR